MRNRAKQPRNLAKHARNVRNVPRNVRETRAKHRETCAKHSGSCVNLMRIRVADPLHIGFWKVLAAGRRHVLVLHGKGAGWEGGRCSRNCDRQREIHPGRGVKGAELEGGSRGLRLPSWAVGDGSACRDCDMPGRHMDAALQARSRKGQSRRVGRRMFWDGMWHIPSPCTFVGGQCFGTVCRVPRVVKSVVVYLLFTI